MYFQQNIKTLRIKQGMTQIQLGNALGLSDAQIRKYENQETLRIRLSTLIDIAAVLEVSIDDLLLKDLSK